METAGIEPAQGFPRRKAPALIEIPLRDRTGNIKAVAIVDDEDAHLTGYHWRLHKTGYVVRAEYLGGGRKAPRFRYPRLHREVAQPPENMQVDHINGDPLDNRRANLRVVTQAENNQNRPVHADNQTSDYRGVDFHRGKWRARAQGRHLGRFDTPEDAMRAVGRFRLENMSHTNEHRVGGSSR